jgi:hypothetical protein
MSESPFWLREGNDFMSKPVMHFDEILTIMTELKRFKCQNPQCYLLGLKKKNMIVFFI